MYYIIWYFQVILILITLGCTYLTYRNDFLKKVAGRDAWLLATICVLFTECGYGLYLQALTLEGLNISRKIYLITGIVALLAWFVTNVSQKEAGFVFSGIFVLVTGVFVASDKLDKYLFSSKTLCQNQYFYYIEETKNGLYYVGKMAIAVLLAITFVSILIKNDDKVSLFAGKSKVFFALATVLPCITLAIGDLEFLKHYPIMAPILAVSMILVQMGLYVNNKNLK